MNCNLANHFFLYRDCIVMVTHLRTKKGYYYKCLKNGNKKRISQKEYSRKKTQKQRKITGGNGDKKSPSPTPKKKSSPKENKSTSLDSKLSNLTNSAMQISRQEPLFGSSSLSGI